MLALGIGIGLTFGAAKGAPPTPPAPTWLTGDPVVLGDISVANTATSPATKHNAPARRISALPIPLISGDSMKSLRLLAAAAIALCVVSSAAQAQVAYTDFVGNVRVTKAVTPTDGLPVNCVSGCSGSGGSGGAVTAAANAYALGSIVDLGTGSSPGANTTNGYLKANGGYLSSLVTNTTGLATAGNQTSGNTKLDSLITAITTLNGKIDTLNTNVTSAIPAGVHTTLLGGATLYLGASEVAAGQTTKSASIPVVLPSDQTVAVAGQAAATGGATAAFTASLSTTVTQLKASAGNLYMLRCYNPNASVAYVQVFALPSASVTLGATTPTQSYGINGTSSGGFALSAVPIGLGGSGISYAATTTSTGSTAPGTALSCNVVFQ